MNRRTLFKGLSTLPFLKHLDLDLSTEVEAAPIPDNPNHWWTPGTELHREPCLSDAAYDRLMESNGMCAPMAPLYDFYCLSDGRRPVRDALPVFQTPRGGIRFIKPQ